MVETESQPGLLSPPCVCNSRAGRGRGRGGGGGGGEGGAESGPVWALTSQGPSSPMMTITHATPLIHISHTHPPHAHHTLPLIFEPSIKFLNYCPLLLSVIVFQWLQATAILLERLEQNFSL